MGHITLGIADIEFFQPDEFVLNDDDLIVLDERPARRQPRRIAVHTVTPRRATARPMPCFDEAPTVVRALPRFARAR